MKNLYILVDNNQYFADHIAFDKIKVEDIVNYFSKKMLNLKIITLDELSKKRDINDSIIFTLSSQKPYHKRYLDDVIEVLSLKNNTLIPSKSILRCHDNKGYQEYYKEFVGISSLKGYYFNNDSVDYDYIDQNYSFPLVLKNIDGSGSRGVQLVKSKTELQKNIRKNLVSVHIRFLIYLKEYFYKFLHLNYSDEKLNYYKDHSNFVIQEFIPNLSFDYKVLVFFDKYYVLKRNINENDFRASGSGNFEFVEIEDSLLDYSELIFKKFNEPFMSLDICFDGKEYYLIEYQGIHFGPYTQIYSGGFYKKQNTKWNFIKEEVSLEEDIAYSLYRTLELNYGNI